MKIFKTTGIVSFPFAVLLLSVAQASSRKHALSLLVDAVDFDAIGRDALAAFGDETVVNGLALYQTTRAIQFKAGEVIGLVSAPDKTQQQSLVELTESAPIDEAQAVTEVQENTLPDVEDDDDELTEVTDSEADINETRMLMLMEAIDQLEEGNDAHWTNAGLPEVSALKQITGGNVTAAERDEAWELYSQDTE